MKQLFVFYKVTNLGLREIMGFRQLHTDFFIAFLYILGLEQRIADQYSVMLRNNLFPETRLERK